MLCERGRALSNRISMLCGMHRIFAKTRGLKCPLLPRTTRAAVPRSIQDMMWCQCGVGPQSLAICLVILFESHPASSSLQAPSYRS